MSERLTFRRKSGDKVYYDQVPEGDAVGYRNNAWTEVDVQIVPDDAIVIDDPLPEVTRDGGIRRAGKTSVHESYSWQQIRSDALNAFALSESLRLDPPVDPEQERIVEQMYDEWDAVYAKRGAPSILDWAIRNGYRVEKVSKP